MGILKWALLFAIAAIFAAAMGFGGLSEGFADIAQLLFVVFLVAALAIGVLGFRAYKRLS
ncbi:DUF1328 family protein [Chondromyces apiculatus]|uniref:Uncharacterized protein n=1 Tax=Chondromyces apiculatus DSM 436 TaxID=1192034 RepID=A0A017TD56_9BACT|nr:DUF1328 family protein [Chondromyces apiculatus]EYF07223.1 Hypothetical protein CAP_0702 [Chondromyces apiculatus DSM 436]